MHGRRSHHHSAWLLVVPALITLALPCWAQEPELPTRDMRVKLGGLTVAPGIEFGGGIDTNVFNVAEQPSRDVVWTVRPKAEVELGLGRAHLSGTGTADLVYFQRTRSERSVNVDATTKLVVPLNRIRPYVSGSFLRTRERPGLDIDARSQRLEHSASAGVTMRVSALTSVELANTRAQVAFDADAVFLGTRLSNELNRTTGTLRLLVREQLTPLTALTMTIDKTRETFSFSPARNSAGGRVALGVELGPSALVSGRASVGYRRLDVSGLSAPRFAGVVASIELAYTALGATRLQVQLTRDTEPSYDILAPYYVSTQVGGSITRQLSDSLGVVARGSRYHLGFRSLEPDASRVDRMVVYGGGVVKRFGRRLRMQGNVDYYRRTSPVWIREYSGLRVTNNFVHGF